MSKKQWYAVRVGKTPGLYKTWGDCERQVSGFSGARYKGFPCRNEASQWLGKPVKYTKKKASKGKSGKKPFKYGPCKPTTTNPGMKNLYFGDTLPWEFPTFIGCIDYEVNVNNFSWAGEK